MVPHLDREVSFMASVDKPVRTLFADVFVDRVLPKLFVRRDFDVTFEICGRDVPFDRFRQPVSEQMDVEEWSSDALVAFLTIARPASSHLTDGVDYFNRVKEKFLKALNFRLLNSILIA